MREQRGTRISFAAWHIVRLGSVPALYRCTLDCVDVGAAGGIRTWIGGAPTKGRPRPQLSGQSLRCRRSDQFFRSKIIENRRRHTGGVHAVACGYCADQTAAARIGLSAADPKLPAGLRV
jgi:hypothetical protein